MSISFLSFGVGVCAKSANVVVMCCFYFSFYDFSAISIPFSFRTIALIRLYVSMLQTSLRSQRTSLLLPLERQWVSANRKQEWGKTKEKVR